MIDFRLRILVQLVQPVALQRNSILRVQNTENFRRERLDHALCRSWTKPWITLNNDNINFAMNMASDRKPFRLTADQKGVS